MTELDYIRLVLSETYTEVGVEIYLRSRNRWLDGARPIDLINAGEGRRVLDIAETLAAGAFG